MAKQRYSTIILSAIITYTGFVACSSEADSEDPEDPSQEYIEHPVEELIPHKEHDYIEVSQTTTFGEMVDPPAELQLLHDYLENPDQVEKHELGVAVSRANGFGVLSSSEDGLIMADFDENRFLSYSLEQQEEHYLASIGDGPGDVNFLTDMIRDNDAVYLSMQDMRITRFDCEYVSCEHNREIMVDFSPYALTSNGEQLAVTGDQPVTRGVDWEEAEGELNEAIRLVDKETGEAKEFFGEFYGSRYPMVKNHYLTGSMLDYCNDSEQYMLAFSDIPYIYVYGSEHQLKEKYHITEFEPNNMLYYPEDRRMRNPQLHPDFLDIDDYTSQSYLTNIRFLDDSLLFIETINESNLQPDDKNNESIQDYVNDYYILDTSENDSYYLGNLEYDMIVSDRKQLFITNNNIILNKGGVVYWIN